MILVLDPETRAAIAEAGRRLVAAEAAAAAAARPQIERLFDELVRVELEARASVRAVGARIAALRAKEAGHV